MMMIRNSLLAALLIFAGCNLELTAPPGPAEQSTSPHEQLELTPAGRFCVSCVKQCASLGMKQCSFTVHTNEQPGQRTCECR